jgi:hypothetical protein
MHEAGIEEAGLVGLRQIRVLPGQNPVSPHVVELCQDKEHNIDYAETNKAFVCSVV